MNRSFLYSMGGVALATLWLNAPVTAQQIDSETEVVVEQTAQTTVQTVSPATEPQATVMPSVIRVRAAESLLDQDVVDVEGEEIGEAEYLMIDVETGEIRFLIVEDDGLFEAEQYLALPWRLVQASRRDELFLDITEAELEQAPRFTEEGIDSLVEQASISRLDAYYGSFSQDVPTGGQVIGAPLPEEIGPENADAANRGVVETVPADQQGRQSASDRPQILVQPDLLSVLMPPQTSALDDLTGAPVILQGDDEPLGEVDQLMLDIDRAQVAYALISRGGFLGIGKQWVPVPFEALRWTPERGAFVIEATEAQLREMVNVTRTDEFIRVPTRDLISLYERFGLRPYWETGNMGARGGDSGVQPITQQSG